MEVYGKIKEFCNTDFTTNEHNDLPTTNCNYAITPTLHALKKKELMSCDGQIKPLPRSVTTRKLEQVVDG